MQGLHPRTVRRPGRTIGPAAGRLRVRCGAAMVRPRWLVLRRTHTPLILLQLVAALATAAAGANIGNKKGLGWPLLKVFFFFFI